MSDDTPRPARRRLRGKAQLRVLLEQRNLAGVLQHALDQGRIHRTLRQLSSLMFDREEVIRWRAAVAMGRVAGLLARGDLEDVRELVRRLLWWMNDESGALMWNAPEAIAEVLINVDDLMVEYAPLLGHYLVEEPFERGSHWALARLGRRVPGAYQIRLPVLRRSLRDPDPTVRGYAILALDAIGAAEEIDAVPALQDDDATLRRYDPESMELVDVTVAEIARAVRGS